MNKDERLPMQKLNDIMTHVRIWQFGLAAGLSPREIAMTIGELADFPKDNVTLVEAITAYAIWSSKPELPNEDDFLGSVEFQTWRKVVLDLKCEGYEPEDVAEAVHHDFERAAGLHTCTQSHIDSLRGEIDASD